MVTGSGNKSSLVIRKKEKGNYWEKVQYQKKFKKGQGKEGGPL